MTRGRRRTGRDPFVVGAIVLAVTAVAVYLGFTKDVPLLNPPYEVTAAFTDSSGITPNSPVRIAGVEVGRVTKVEHVSPGARAARVTMSIKDKGRPVHRDASAKIRPRIFLEGNFFVDLKPGTPAAGEMDDDATIPVARTANPVQFDELLSVLKSDVRADLRQAFVELGRTQEAGGAAAFNDSLRHQPAAYRYSAVVSEALLGRRPGDLGDWVRDQGTVAQAATADRAQLRNLVTDFNATARALAAEQASLRAAVDTLPDTLRAAVPAFRDLDAAFPDVRRFARAARPAVRSTGPTVDVALPLVRQLRGLVRPGELRGLTADLRGATPSLAQVSRTSVDVLGRARELASCTNEVLVPYGNSRLTDRAFPSTGPVHQELVKFLPGLAGESRSFDGNGQWFKVLGTGGLETVTLGNGLFGTVADPIVGVNPPPTRTRPPLRPETPCETQETPDLDSRPGRPPATVRTDAAASRRREAKAQDVAIAVLRRQLRAQGEDTKVLDRPITLAEIRRLAGANGLTGQLEKALKGTRR
jgi:virulence factor Mce-like protein